MGASGVGKSTLINKLTAKYPDSFGFSVSSTTRQPREGEEHGKSYYFRSDEEFEEMIKNDAFTEWANVHKHKYGTEK